MGSNLPVASWLQPWEGKGAGSSGRWLVVKIDYYVVETTRAPAFIIVKAAQPLQAGGATACRRPSSEQRSDWGEACRCVALWLWIGWNVRRSRWWQQRCRHRRAGQIPDGDWRTINRDLPATRYSPLDQINRSNVAQLKVAWSYPLRGVERGAAGDRQQTLFYRRQPGGRARCRNWQGNLGPYRGAGPRAQPFSGLSGRGVGYWPGNSKTLRRKSW